MEEYIQLMADKARGRDQTFNWETATYGEVYCEDLDSFKDFETDFPTIVYNGCINIKSECFFQTHSALLVCNYGVICEDMLEGALFGAKTMIFEDSLILFNKLYPGKKIRRISAWISQENAHSHFPIRHIHVPSYAVSSWITIQRFGE
ncbi:hypothetical protein Tco_1045596 [Tanacetum coccineum]|uniref:Uncharacterized protein n=1 Tax=Tanacetum coccineum TaxID=301880 RepID=A0ABQ5GT87_9ASTR